MAKGGGRGEGDNSKRKAADEAGGEAKKRKGYVCPIACYDFVKNAVPYTFKFDADPKEFSTGGFGWTKYSVNKIEADGDGAELGNKEVIAQMTCNMNVLGSKEPDPSCGLAKAKFLAEAGIEPVELQALPYEFSTGSFGWAASTKQMIKVAGQALQVQVGLNAVVRGSKPAGPEEDGDDPALTDIDSAAVAKHFGVIGTSTHGEKDDLKRMKGIGPLIERRLHKIGIYTFEQISKFAPEIEEDVNAAIKYFPGRVRADEWASQAKEFARKKKRG